MTSLLLVDDNRGQRLSTAHFLRETHPVHVEEAESGKDAWARLANTALPPIGVVLLDLFMPEMDGRQTLKAIRSLKRDLPVIMLTASDEIEDAVELMREGACDFITKPFDPNRLNHSIKPYLAGEHTSRNSSLKQAYTLASLTGVEQGLKETARLARKAASSGIPVLLTGESGTGKEVLARIIHHESARKDKPFIAVNCGAIPDNLVESTLFGHEKGAFTGAVARGTGKFREAAGGTLFLDEVGELKPDMQTKLLRALQSQEIEPVGAGKPVTVDVRIIAATHRNLSQDVRSGRFRADLFYRLSVFPLPLPPLRERTQDIPALAGRILADITRKERKPALAIDVSGMEWLMRQHWAGNVRELENLLYRAVVMSEKNELRAADFMTMGMAEAGGLTKSDAIALCDETGRAFRLDEIETEVIRATLKRLGGHVPHAAKTLGMGQSTLYKKLALPRP